MRHVLKTASISVILVTAIWSGCAGYAGQVKDMRTALYRGDLEEAMDRVNRSLRLRQGDHYPTKLKEESALLLLERASIKQAMGDFRASAIDFQIADAHLEWIDIQRDPVGRIAEWVLSGSGGAYRMPPHEKLLLHTVNLLNYLALGQLESARVEARRFNTLQRYLADGAENGLASLGIGNYMAGFAYEMSGRYEQAIQQYTEALKDGSYSSAIEALRRIAPCTTYRNAALEALLAQSEEQDGTDVSDPDPIRVTCELNASEKGTLLVVSHTGLAPHKIARRIPIGAAIVLAGAYLAPEQLSRAQGLAVKGLLKWINFTELAETRSYYTTVQAQLNGTTVPTESGQDVSAVVRRSFAAMEGKMMAAAIVRMLARAGIGAGTGAAVEAAGGDSVFALLAQVLVEGAMTAADTPDTRCWNTLPDRIHLTRVEVPAGRHLIDIRLLGVSSAMVSHAVDIRPGGFVVIPVQSMR